MEKLLAVDEQWAGKQPVRVEKLPGAGSNRVYYRMWGEDEQTVVGVIGTSRDEDHAFIYLSNHFHHTLFLLFWVTYKCEINFISEVAK